MLQSAPTHTDLLDPRVICGDGFITTPAENVTLQFKAFGTDMSPIAQTDAFVFNEGAGQTVTYELKPLEEMAVGVTFFGGSIPPYDLPNAPGLEDIFSPNLHISRVRVLKVPKQKLPLKGKPVIDGTPVKPSRLVFIPGFQNGQSVFSRDANRCFANLATTDGDFDLTRCRPAFGNRTEALLATTPAYLDGEPGKLLTWVAEFKESEGGVVPSFDAETEMLVIEFTIEAN
jgi:hypothetical protein